MFLPPITNISGHSTSRHRLSLAAILILSATLLLAGHYVTVPDAHADGHQLTVEISTGAASHTDLRTIPFGMEFNRPINDATLNTSDISATSGTVRNLRLTFQNDADFGGAGSGDGQFNNASGVAVGGPSGRIYVADTGNDRVSVFDSALEPVSHITGLDGPSGVAVDGSGRIYVADTGNDRIAVFNPALESVLGITGLDGPSGVAVDGSGRIYVADTGNDRIEIFNPALQPVSRIDFAGPSGVAVNGSSGHIYVVGTGNDLVAVFNSTLNRTADITRSFAGPSGVAVDSASGAIYVADTGNDRVSVFGPAGHHIADIAGPFHMPSGVAVNGSSGTVYVADTGNDLIRIFDTVYAFDVADPVDGQTLAVSLPSGSVQDTAGNENIASNLVSIGIDRTPPDVLSARITGSGQITVRYSEPVNVTGSAYGTPVVDDIRRTYAADPLSGNGTAVHTLAFTGSLPVQPWATGTFTLNMSAITDAAGHTAGTATAGLQTLADGQPPELTSAGVTGPNRVTIRYSEPVTVTPDAYGTPACNYDLVMPSCTQPYGKLRVGSLPRTYPSNPLSGNGEAVHTLTFAGSAAAPGTAGTLTMNLPAITDAAGNALGTSTASSQALAADQGPKIISARVTGPGLITVQYRDPVNAAGSAYGTLVVDDVTRTYTADPLAGDGTATHTLSFTGGAPVPTGAGGTLTMNQSAITDSAGGTLGTSTAAPQVLADGQPPRITSATVTGPDLITIRYSEPAYSTVLAYGTFVVDGTSRTYAADPLSGDGTAVHTLEFIGGAPVPTGAGGTIILNRPEITDSVGNALGSATAGSQTLDDGQPPRIASAAVTSPDRVTIRYSEPVNVTDSAYDTLMVDGTPRTITAGPPAGNGTAVHTLAFTGGAAAQDATGTLTMNQSAITDSAGHTLGVSTASQQALEAGQIPKIISAAVTSPDRITIRYSEPVNVTGSAYGTLMVDGTPRTITAGPPAGNGTAVHTLVFTGGTPVPTGAIGTITLNLPEITDSVGSAVGTSTAAPQDLADGQPPRIASAAVTGADRITVRYSEPAYATGSAYGALVVDGTPRTHTNNPFSGDGTATHVISFTGGTPVPTGANGTIILNMPEITDSAGRALGNTAAVSYALADGQPPRITSAAVTGADLITIRYSEPVNVTDSAYGTLVVDGTPRTHAAGPPAGNGTAVHILAFTGGAPVPTGAGGTLTLNQSAITDSAGHATGTMAAGRQSLTDGQPPRIVSAAVTGPDRVTIQYSEPVTVTDQAYGLPVCYTLYFSQQKCFVPQGRLYVDGYVSPRLYQSDPLSGNGSPTHTLAFIVHVPAPGSPGSDVGPPAQVNANGTIILNQRAITDAAGHTLGALTASPQKLVAGQTLKITSAAVTGPDRITIRYVVPAYATGSAYGALVVDGTPRTYTSNPLSGDGTVAHTLSFTGGAPVPTGATGTLTLNPPEITNPAGRPLGSTAASTHALADGQPPRITSAAVTDPNRATIRYSEPVNATGFRLRRTGRGRHPPYLCGRSAGGGQRHGRPHPRVHRRCGLPTHHRHPHTEPVRNNRRRRPRPRHPDGKPAETGGGPGAGDNLGRSDRSR